MRRAGGKLRAPERADLMPHPRDASSTSGWTALVLLLLAPAAWFVAGCADDSAPAPAPTVPSQPAPVPPPPPPEPDPPAGSPLDGSFTNSEGRTARFRLHFDESWDLNEPRGVLIFLHGLATGTTERLVGFIPADSEPIASAHELGLIAALVASPQSTPRGHPVELFDQEFEGGGRRAWEHRDLRLLHELLQSGFGASVAVNHDRIVFLGASQGTCFLARFFERYAGIYGGGFHAWCGCLWDPDSGRRPPRAAPEWSPSFPWNPSSAALVGARVRVFVQATTGDFLHDESVALAHYYDEILGLDTRWDLAAPGGHCAPGVTPWPEIWEWLSAGGLQARGAPPMDEDPDGDGIPNPRDPDDDDDGALDFLDALPTDRREYLDTDRDGIGNFEDRDADGDGVENAADPFPLDPAEWRDTDGDGIGDNLDDDDDGDGMPDRLDPVLDTDAPSEQLAFRTNVEGVSPVTNAEYPVARTLAGRNASVVLPEPEGDEQSYHVFELGDGTREFHVMVDRFHRAEACETALFPELCEDPPDPLAYFEHFVDRIHVDRNQNRDLTDDGPPLLLARNREDPWREPGVHTVLHVSYASGETLPYAIRLWTGRDLSQGLGVMGGSTWVGEVHPPVGEPVLVGVIDANVDGLFNTGGPRRFVGNSDTVVVASLEDFVCIDTNRNGTLDECSRDEDGNRPGAVGVGGTFLLDGLSLRVEVAPTGHRVRFVGTE